MKNNTYRLKIVGKNPEQFLKMLYTLHIELWLIEKIDKGYIIEVSPSSYEKIKKIKTSYKITIVNRHGIIALIHHLKKYYLLLISGLIGFLLLVMLSHLIFKVEIVHNDPSLRSFLTEELKEYGITPFHLQVGFKKQEAIVKDILTKHKDKIEWMEIERIGTKYIVRVEPRKYNEETKEGKPQDIVAKKDGIITKIDAKTGSITKQVNDYVKKGDVIITGIIKNQDTVMTTVVATGTVMAETWYKINVEMPLNYYEQTLTGKSKNILKISFLTHDISLFDFHPYKNYKDIDTPIIKNDLLPFSLKKVTRQEALVKDEVYTEDTAIKKASQLASEKLLKTLGVNDKIILEKTLKITRKDSKIILDIFFKVEEDITDFKEIDLTQLAKDSEEARN